MSYSISHHQRLNPKKERTKTPFKGKNKNRKGNRKDTRESLNPDKPVRFTEKKLNQRVYDIHNLGKCQICEDSYELDYPHHVDQGSKKDDRTMINICVTCHRLIHGVGYSAVKKDRSECLVIALNNHEILEKTH